MESTEPPSLSVCKGAKADIVFLTDASWSIGDDNFNKVVKFIFNTIGAFDLINPAGIQVCLFFLSSNMQENKKLNKMIKPMLLKCLFSYKMKLLVLHFRFPLCNIVMTQSLSLI